jgi:hypothetical protein
MKIENEITFEPDAEWMSAGNRIQVCNIRLNGENIGFERSYFPWNVFKEPTHAVSHNRVFFDKGEAERAAERFSAKVEQDPYDETAFVLWFYGGSRYDNLVAFHTMQGIPA